MCQQTENKTAPWWLRVVLILSPSHLIFKSAVDSSPWRWLAITYYLCTCVFRESNEEEPLSVSLSAQRYSQCSLLLQQGSHPLFHSADSRRRRLIYIPIMELTSTWWCCCCQRCLLRSFCFPGYKNSIFFFLTCSSTRGALAKSAL